MTQSRPPVDPADPTALVALADQLADRFPWYRTLLAEHGVTATTELADYPVLDEAALTAHYYTASHDTLPDAATYRTSGTSGGGRKQILYSPQDEQDYAAHRRALFADRAGVARPGEVAVADLGTGHAAAAAHRVFAELGYDARDVDFRRPVAQHVEALNEWRPDVLFTMPMILDQLMQSPELRIAPRHVAVVGDLAPASWRRHVASFFDIDVDDVLDVFGSIEVGAIGYWCAETGLYHFHDHIVPEVVAPGYLSPGRHDDLGPDSGILLLTSFARRYFPALRYATNDVVTGLRTIRWQGRKVRAFDRIEGRYRGEIKHGERISSHDLTSAVSQVFPGAAFEVRNDRQLEIRVVADRITDDDVARVRALLAAASPDVAQMIDSGLVGQIQVVAIGVGQLSSTNAKRQFDLRSV